MKNRKIFLSKKYFYFMSILPYTLPKVSMHKFAVSYEYETGQRIFIQSNHSNSLFIQKCKTCNSKLKRMIQY